MQPKFCQTRPVQLAPMHTVNYTRQHILVNTRDSYLQNKGVGNFAPMPLKNW
jgi:hypothetical protein